MIKSKSAPLCWKNRLLILSGTLLLAIHLLFDFDAMNYRSYVSERNERTFNTIDEYLNLSDEEKEVLNTVESDVTSLNNKTSDVSSLNNKTSGSGDLASLNKNVTSDVASFKIAAFTDIDFVEIAEWWYQRMTNLSYTTHTIVVIDEESKQYFTNLNNKANQTVYRFEEEMVDRLEKRGDRVANLWYHRILYVYNQLKAGNSILLTDTDNIFTRYEPITSFRDSGYDAIFALGEHFPDEIFHKMGFVVCAGMNFYKSTEATLKLVEKWLTLCDGPRHKQGCNDQANLNKLLLDEMEWNSTWAREESRLADGGLIQYGFDGVGTTIPNFRAKVWDKDFAWRGVTFAWNEANVTVTHCPPPRTNWVSMPHALPNWAMKEMGAHRLGTGGFQKLAKIKLWEILCAGTNGTRTIDEGLKIYKAIKSK